MQAERLIFRLFLGFGMKTLTIERELVRQIRGSMEVCCDERVENIGRIEGRDDSNMQIGRFLFDGQVNVSRSIMLYGIGLIIQ
jgi:hypothetical protein